MVSFRPITKIQCLLDHIGFSITYAYDDLVFVEHNVFLLQFEKGNEHIALFLNVQSDQDKREKLIKNLQKAGSACELTVAYKGLFSLEQKDNNEISISFF
jgi:RecJ-like exonuclease